MTTKSWSLLSIALGLGLTFASPERLQQSSAPAPSKPPAAKSQANADEPENDPALMLTDEQKAHIKAIREDARLQVLATGKDTSFTPEQKDRRIKQIRKATRAQVFAVLTPDQQKTWSAEQREKRESKSPPPKSR